jgi:starch phosphorylase
MNLIPIHRQTADPAALKPLEEIAADLWASWNHDAQNLFVRLDFDAWTRATRTR